MPSESKDTIIIRVKPAVKRAARRGAKAEKVNLTAFLVSLIERYDVANQAPLSEKEA
jgi:uncharacterized protein (DUF1778 family)